MKSKRKRSPITLLEVMIVILLIGVIGGVLSYNLKGALDRGKKFRTEEGIKRLKEILDFEIERGAVSVADLTGPTAYDKVKTCVEQSGLIAKNKVEKFLEDGWNERYTYQNDTTDKTNPGVNIISKRLTDYLVDHPDPQK